MHVTKFFFQSLALTFNLNTINNKYLITGQGTEADFDFCSISNPCSYKQGDCDDDNECAKDHFCGKDNCRDYRSEATADSDCCIPG